MKKITNKQLVLIKKCIPIGCALLCLLFMLFNVLTFTSSTTFSNGQDVYSESGGFSLFGFLLGKESTALGMNFYILRKLFPFSYVVAWISFVLQIIALCILIYGVFSKKSMFSKIGSVCLLVSYAILILVSFDTFSIGITVKYLSVFNVFYFIEIVLCTLSMFSTFTIKEK